MFGYKLGYMFISVYIKFYKIYVHQSHFQNIFPKHILVNCISKDAIYWKSGAIERIISNVD